MCVDKAINRNMQRIGVEKRERKEKRGRRREKEEERKKRGEPSLPKNLYIIQRVDPRQELNLGKYYLTCVNSI